ncbi:hypothetical protein ACLKA7_007991 [Drosophila subpalustris]
MPPVPFAKCRESIKNWNNVSVNMFLASSQIFGSGSTPPMTRFMAARHGREGRARGGGGGGGRDHVTFICQFTGD